MDVLVLIDKLDDLVHNAKAVPLTDQVRIDREEIYDILDQMRATIPEEIKQARWIVKERQEMLAEAKRETDRLVNEAREQAVREASQTEIVKIAERQAQEIVDEARRQARETRLEMEDWADGILSTLEVNLDKFLQAVKRGRERLQERSQESVVAGVGPIVEDDGGGVLGRAARRSASPTISPGSCRALLRRSRSPASGSPTAGSRRPRGAGRGSGSRRSPSRRSHSGSRVRLSRLELAFLGALGLVAAWAALSAAWSRSLPSSVLESQRLLVYAPPPPRPSCSPGGAPSAGRCSRARSRDPRRRRREPAPALTTP